MNRAAALALALSACTLAAPAIGAGAPVTTPANPDAPGTSPAIPAPSQAPSPFKQDPLSSTPLGLTPSTLASPFRYPDEPVVLSWGDVPGAVGYHVEISANPGFSKVVWQADTVQPIAVPEVLLPDGEYWWRVRAVDAAGTVGVNSDVARFAKTWPNTINGTRVASSPGGGAVTYTALNPYMTWNAVPGAATYEGQVAFADQFATPTFQGLGLHAPFMSPAIDGAIPDGSYSWRVRARDPKGNTGPWAVGIAFTKAWVAPVVVSPADDAVTSSLGLVWNPVEGATQYQVQMSSQANNFSGDALKINATTNNNSFAPALSEQKAKSLSYGDVYWRVRPIVNGIYGTWSAQRHITWQAPSSTTSVPSLSSSGDSTTGLMPALMWTPVTGANLYRVDIATDAQFNNIVESALTTSTLWTPRSPLPDTQIGSGYHWRVVWGSGVSDAAPGWMVDETTAPTDTFRKQTRVVLGSAAGGAFVTDPPLLTWSSVPGIAQFEVQLSSNGQFDDTSTTRTARVFGVGVVPGSMVRSDTRLPDGAWSWRVRPIDGSGTGQTWSPVGTFTLTSPRPPQREPNDGATVVFSPLIRWSAVPGACSYDVDVSRDPAFKDSGGDKTLNTFQTALVPPKGTVTTPGKHYWRVRADYCDGIKGQWSPTRDFRSVFPPSFNLNSIPNRVDYQRLVVVGGQLRHNGAVVKSARLYLERRLWPSDEFRPAGTIRTNNQGRFRFQLRMLRSANYRLVWRESATNPEGKAAFGINVTPRVSFRLASSRVARKRGLLVKGSIFPRRPAIIQLLTSDGWQPIRRVAPRGARFSVSVPTTRLDPGSHRLRLWVPRDAQRKFVNMSSRQHGVLVFDKFVIRGRR